MTTSTQTKLLDRICYIASFACCIHCILTPIIILAAPFLGQLFESSNLEIGLLLFSIMSGFWIIYSGYCSHKKTHTLFIFFLGTISWILHVLSDFIGFEQYATLLLLVGSGCMLLSYRVNHKLLKCCCKHHHTHS